MKKIVLSAIMCIAFVVSTGTVMAQDVKGTCKEKTECTRDQKKKSCSKENSACTRDKKECTKKAETKACCKDKADKK